MTPVWDGKERRSKNDMSQEDRELLVRIDENIGYLKESSAHLKDAFRVHIADDKEAFKNQSKDIAFLQKCIYLGMGGLFVINILIGIFLKK